MIGVTYIITRVWRQSPSEVQG